MWCEALRNDAGENGLCAMFQSAGSQQRPLRLPLLDRIVALAVIIATIGAVATERVRADRDLALVEDFFATAVACCAVTSAADDRRHRRAQNHRLPRKDVGGGHALVAK